MNEIIKRTTIVELVAERDQMMKQAETTVKALAVAAEESAKFQTLDRVLTSGHKSDLAMENEYRAMSFQFSAEKVADLTAKAIDAAFWLKLYKVSGYMDLLSHGDLKKFREKISAGDVEVFDQENAEHLALSVLRDSGDDFARGVAESFSALDRRFRSHNGFKIGSRIIITSLYVDGYSRTDRFEMLADVERAFAVLDGRARTRAGIVGEQLNKERGLFEKGQTVHMTEYFKIRVYQNGNAHLWMLRPDLVEKVNKLIAEYYGKVIPDGHPANVGPDLKSKGGLPAKKLQFYPTPKAVITRMLMPYHLRGVDVLEPSAGDGAIVKELVKHKANVTAVEIHPDRAMLISAKYRMVNVKNANFLQLPPRPKYDRIFMNPPFYGTHWMAHVMHAFEFLEPGGTITAVLPESAISGITKKHKAFREFAKLHSRFDKVDFIDLPVGSFAESGTNINTVILTITKR